MASSGSLVQRLSTSKKERNCITELQFREAAIKSTDFLLKGLVIHRKSMGCWIIVLVYMEIRSSSDEYTWNGKYCVNFTKCPGIVWQSFSFRNHHCLNYHGRLSSQSFFFLTKTVDNIKAWPMVGMFSVLPTLCQENPSIIGGFSS